MKIEATPDMVANWIADALRIKAEQTDNEYIYNFSRDKGQNQIIKLPISKILEVLQYLSTKTEFEDTAIYDERSYEVIVRQENSSTPFSLGSRFRDGKFQKTDAENKVTYILSNPSDEYILFLLYKLSKIGPLRLSFTPSVFRLERIWEREQTEYSIFEILKFTSSRLMTLRVESERNRALPEFLKYANSFFFQMGYNLDIAVVPQRYLTDFVRTSRIKQLRRTNIDDLEAPKRFYIPDLIYHYQLAIASDSPPLEYLSFYHIIEHFFDAVFNDDLIEKIRNRIMQPDFSYKRKKDIKNLIDLIGKLLKYRGENVTFSEPEALRLTLEKYVDISVLVEKIKEYDASLVEFYRGNLVPFSDGDQVDLESSDKSQIMSTLAKRIYKTRNAIVHSKENEKVRYIPFEHDKLLVKEVPILRFIAELIIIETSFEIP